ELLAALLSNGTTIEQTDTVFTLVSDMDNS
ncbi:hypothetical protein CISIN_1g0394371mg, partial [Citrus sinensis]